MTAKPHREFKLPDNPTFEYVEDEEVIFEDAPLDADRIAEIVARFDRRDNLIPGGKSLNGDGSHAHRLSVRVPDDVRDKLAAIASKRGVSASKLVRDVLTDFAKSA